MKESGNLIVDLTFKFSLDITEYTDSLEQLHKYSLAKQLFNSGTSVGANVNEAQNPESRRDFIHKLKVAMKEAGEAQYWLNICKYSKVLPDPPENLFSDIISIRKVIGKILSTSYRQGGQM